MMRGRETPGETPVVCSPGRSHVVVYDGDCNVCRKIVDLLPKWDRDDELEILPLQTPGLAARFPWIPEPAYLESLQVVRCADGRTWQGAAAVEQLLDVMPKGKFVSWIFSIPLARPLAENFYRWFGRNRYHLGCGDHCQTGDQRFQ